MKNGTKTEKDIGEQAHAQRLTGRRQYGVFNQKKQTKNANIENVLNHPLLAQEVSFLAFGIKCPGFGLLY